MTCDAFLIVRNEAPVLVLIPAAQGMPGPAGAPGSAGAAISALPIGGVVQALRLVRATNGVVYPVDTAQAGDAAEVIGVALQSVTTIGDSVNVQRAGTVSDSHWSWAPGVVWAGADGSLTQSPASTGFLMQVGRVINATTIDIDIESPIYRG